MKTDKQVDALARQLFKEHLAEYELPESVSEIVTITLRLAYRHGHKDGVVETLDEELEELKKKGI